MLLTTVESVQTKESRVRQKFADLFDGIGVLNTGDQYVISLNKDAKPYGPPVRRLPPAIVAQS